MFQELELFGVATVNSKGTCEVGEKCSQEPNNVKRPFLLVPGPLKGLEVVKPGIPDLWTSAFLLFPDRNDKPPHLLLPTSCFLPLPLSYFGVTSQTPGLHFPCVTAGRKIPAWLIDPAWPACIVPCSPQPTSLTPHQSCCFWTLHPKQPKPPQPTMSPLDKCHLPLRPLSSPRILFLSFPSPASGPCL